jgi:antitoxin component YwqK of YwqJK toxin-antitoxin module
LSIAQDSTSIKKWPNDTKKEQGQFLNMKKQGKWKHWNQKGELILVQEYKLDSLQKKTTKEYYEHTKNLLFTTKTYNSSNKLIELREYNYRDNNTYTVTNYKNGIKTSTGKIKNNLRQGRWKYYNENHNLISEENFKNDIKIEKSTKEKESLYEISKNRKEYKWLSKNFINNSNLYKKSEWIDGYFIPKQEENIFNSDTIFTKISFSQNLAGPHFYKIKVQIDNQESIKIQASEIISFSRGINVYYSGYFKENHSFAYELISGEASLYSNTQSNHTFERNSVSNSYNPKLLTTWENMNYYIKFNNSNKMILFPTSYKYKKFLLFMKKHFSQDKMLMNLIKKGTLNSKDVIEIILRYNHNKTI